MKDFASYLDENLSLDFPFNDSYNYFDIYEFCKNDFYLLENQKKIQIENKNNQILCNPSLDRDFFMDQWKYTALKDLVKNLEQVNNKSYYIITSFDQTFSGINMYDWRCQ